MRLCITLWNGDVEQRLPLSHLDLLHAVLQSETPDSLPALSFSDLRVSLAARTIDGASGSCASHPARFIGGWRRRTKRLWRELPPASRREPCLPWARLTVGAFLSRPVMSARRTTPPRPGCPASHRRKRLWNLPDVGCAPASCVYRLLYTARAITVSFPRLSRSHDARVLPRLLATARIAGRRIGNRGR